MHVCDRVRDLVVCQKRYDSKTLNGPRRYTVESLSDTRMHYDYVSFIVRHNNNLLMGTQRKSVLTQVLQNR